MGQSITTRLSDDIVKEVEKICEAEQLDKSSVVRRLLVRAIAEWNLENAITRFHQDKISLGKAVELSKISTWEFIEELNKRNIPLHYDEEDLRDDIECAKNIQSE